MHRLHTADLTINIIINPFTTFDAHENKFLVVTLLVLKIFCTHTGYILSTYNIQIIQV